MELLKKMTPMVNQKKKKGKKKWRTTQYSDRVKRATSNG